MVRVSNPGRDRIFFSCLQCPERLWGKIQLHIQWVPEFFSTGVRRPGGEVENSYSSVEVKWSGVFPF
jgi:hypothetical protein